MLSNGFAGHQVANAVDRARGGRTNVPGWVVNRRARLAGYQVVAGGLILGLIRLHSPAFKSNVAVQVVNVDGLRRTVIPTPENRQVGDRARPWAPPWPA